MLPWRDLSLLLAVAAAEQAPLKSGPAQAVVV
jgi:hypothetical protein